MDELESRSLGWRDLSPRGGRAHFVLRTPRGERTACGREVPYSFYTSAPKRLCLECERSC